MTEWELVRDHTDPEVRRIAVPCGWLYQVRTGSGLSDGWHPPVFVPEPRDVVDLAWQIMNEFRG